MEMQNIAAAIGIVTGCAGLVTSIKANKIGKEARDLAEASIQPFLKIRKAEIKQQTVSEIREKETFKIKQYTAIDLDNDNSFRTEDVFIDESIKMVLELMFENEGSGDISHIEIKEFLLAYGDEKDFENKLFTSSIVAPPLGQPLNDDAIKSPSLFIGKENRIKTVNILFEKYENFDDSILYDFLNGMETAVLLLRVEISLSNNIKKDFNLIHFFEQ